MEGTSKPNIIILNYTLLCKEWRERERKKAISKHLIMRNYLIN